MSNKNRGQIAIEYMLLLALGTLIVIIALGIVSIIFQNQLDEKRHNLMDDFALSLQNEIILASQVEKGYERVIYIPHKLDGVEYLLSNTNLSLTITYEKGSITLLTPLTRGSLDKGEKTLTNRETHILIS